MSGSHKPRRGWRHRVCAPHPCNTVADGVKVPADQPREVRIGSGDGGENLAPTRCRFDIADPYLQMPLAVLTAPDESRIQGDHDRRRRRSRPGRGTIPQRLAGSQSMAAQGLRVGAGVDRKHLLQHVSGGPIAHQGGEMRLKLIQLRCRLAMRWPADASLEPATRGTAISRKPHRDLAEQRRYATFPVVLHTAIAAIAPAIPPANRVLPGLRGDDLLLHVGQQQLRFGQGQTQIGNIAEIIGPDDLHDVRALPLTLSPGFHQPHNPRHAPTPGQKQQTRKYPSMPYTPNLEAVPLMPLQSAKLG